MQPKNKKRMPILAIVFLPLILLYVGIVFVVVLPYRLLQFLFHVVTGSFRSARVILVYSNSVKWKSEIETQIIPNLPPDSKIFNISKPDPGLSKNFDYYQYSYWAGRKEYCPIVILRRPFRKPILFRFYKAFRKASGGNGSELQVLIQTLLSSLRAFSSAT